MTPLDESLELQTMLAGFSSDVPAVYQANGVQIPATNSALVPDAVIIPADTTQITISFWAYANSAALAVGDVFIRFGFNYYQIFLSNTSVRVSGRDGVNTFQATTGAGASANQWQHVLASLDTNALTAQVWVNDVQQSLSFTGSTPLTMPISTSWTNSRIGIPSSGELVVYADLWILAGSYIDFTNTTIRRKFICADLGAPSLGSNGQLPLGSPPTFFFSGPAATWNINLGTGDTWHVVSGPLSDFSPLPPVC